MRILLIAYDYPPTHSPRALRWRYLTRELALLGHEVHVLVPDLGDPGIELPQASGSLVVHRSFPGPYGWIVGRANRRRARQQPRGRTQAHAPPPAVAAPRLNWRGRIMDLAKRCAGLFAYPDVRAEWNPWAHRALRRLLAQVRPDVVVTSHEPASTLPLGIRAQRLGFPWVADLGDPVCAAYTPRRWRKRALALEARVSALADGVLVTNQATRSLLVERHALDPQRCAVLPNGYDDRRVPPRHGAAGPASFDEDRLELVYAGRLYGYRDPTPLLQAVAASPGVRLTLVVPDPPPGDDAAVMAAAAGDRLRVLGLLPHAQVQTLLEQADVLVNLGDRGQPVRTPAKLFEYLGMRRPILHVHSEGADAAAGLLRDLRRGWLCADDADALARLLVDLRQRKQGGSLHQGLQLAPMPDYAHSALGRRLEELLAKAVKSREVADGQPAEAALPEIPALEAPPPGVDHEPNEAYPRRATDRCLGNEIDGHGGQDEDLERALRARTAQVAALKARTKEQEGEIEILGQRIAWLDAQVVALQSSTSWRVTAPLRLASTALRRIRVKLGPGRGQGSSTRPRKDAASAKARPPAVLEGEDTFVLYRIIGNDLHPRHKHGQSVGNLQFILEHEPALDGCEKRFVVNRILDADQERKIIELLEQAGVPYLRIPFDARQYAATGFDVDCLPDPGFLAGEGFQALDDAARDRVYAALYRHKNNYAMNNNGARNAALEDGRGRAKWILPWDGNCFLTRTAWAEIRKGIAGAPQNRYFTVPMARMPSNDLLISGGAVPRAVEEPQVIFRTDAVERFNDTFCYGRRPKVELLWRLDVRGPWDDYPDDPWDQPRAPVSPDAGAVGRAGWVARLSSGMTTLEADSEQAPLHRGLARTGAILVTLQGLDARLAGADSERPVSVRPAVLRQEVGKQDDPPLRGVVRTLIQAADQAVARGEAPLQQALDDSMVLALAWSFTGEAGYAERGADLLARLFVNPQMRLAPGFASAHRQDATTNAPVGLAMAYCLDAVRLFERAGRVREPVRGQLRAWLESRLQWLSDSPEAAQERRSNDYRGTWHDLETAAIASFLDERKAVYGILARAQSRIGMQFASDGSQPAQASGTPMTHTCCLNFQGWIHLAELASHWGVDLWSYQAPNGSALAQGARWLLSRPGGSWPDDGDGGFDAQRLQPLRFAASVHVDGLPDLGNQPASPYLVKPVFPPQAGIRPFWNLASHGQGEILSTA